VRTWPLRGTLHLVCASDVRWLLELTAAKTLRGAATRHAQAGLDAPTFAKARKVIEKGLRSGAPMRRTAIYALLEAHSISTAGQRGLHLLWGLAHEGVLCFGPRDGKQPTFVLLEAWVPQAKALPRDEALAELARRYLAGHGPASVRDFAWWSGLAAAEARRAFEAIRGACSSVVIGGTEHRSLGAPHVPRASSSVQLLPAFDELVVGYTQREALGEPSALAHLLRGGIIGPALVEDGRLIGRWSRALKPGQVEVTLEPLVKKAGAQALRAAAERYARFLGLRLR
jgi:hypothetical protein